MTECNVFAVKTIILIAIWLKERSVAFMNVKRKPNRNHVLFLCNQGMQFEFVMCNISVILITFIDWIPVYILLTLHMSIYSRGLRHTLTFHVFDLYFFNRYYWYAVVPGLNNQSQWMNHEIMTDDNDWGAIPDCSSKCCVSTALGWWRGYSKAT